MSTHKFQPFLTVQSKDSYIKKLLLIPNCGRKLSTIRQLDHVHDHLHWTHSNTVPLRSFWSEEHTYPVVLICWLFHNTWIRTCTLPRITSFSRSLQMRLTINWFAILHTCMVHGLLHKGHIKKIAYEVSKLSGCLFVQSAAAHLSLTKCWRDKVSFLALGYNLVKCDLYSYHHF